MRKILCALIVFCSIISKAQTIVRGTVYDDKDNSELIGVSVVLKGTTDGQITDDKGKFELQVKPGRITLVFSYMGYDSRNVDVLVREGESKTINTRLSETQMELDIVVVTGAKYEKKLGEETVSMEVLKGAQITQSNSRAEEALNYVPGVNMLGKNTSIRGGGSFADGAGSRVLVMLDDIPIISPENGGVNWSGMPLEAVEQVEIIKGAVSASYGSSAMNGIMNFRTMAVKPEMYNKLLINFGLYQQPKDKKMSWFWNRKRISKNGDTTSRIHRPLFGGFQFTHAKRYGNLDVLVSGAYQEDEGFRYANRSRIIRGFGKLRYIPKKFDKINVGVNFSVLREDYQDFFILWGYGNDTVQTSWPSYAKATYGVPNFTTTNADSFAYFPTELSNRLTTTVSVDPFINYYDPQGNRHSLKHRTYYTQIYNTAGAGDSSETRNHYFDYSFLKEFKALALVITTGASYFYTNAVGTTFSRKTAHNAGAYFQFDKKFFGKLTLNAGVRLEFAKLDTIVQTADIWSLSINSGNTRLVPRAISPVIPVFRVGLNYQAAEGTFIRASWGQGFRYPAIAEKFTRTVRSGAQVFPNSSLLPEAGWGAELGVKQGIKISRWLFFADLSGFVNYYNNMIEFQTLEPGEEPGVALGFKAKNVPAVRIMGCEVSSIGSGKIYGVPLNFMIGYTFLNPINLAYDPNVFQLDYKILKYRIEHSFKADISTNYKGFMAGVRCFFNSFMKEIDKVGVGALQSVRLFREGHNKGDFVMDLRAGYSYKEKISFNVMVKNISNTEYTLRPGLIEAPRNYTFQVGYQF